MAVAPPIIGVDMSCAHMILPVVTFTAVKVPEGFSLEGVVRSPPNCFSPPPFSLPFGFFVTVRIWQRLIPET